MKTARKVGTPKMDYRVHKGELREVGKRKESKRTRKRTSNQRMGKENKTRKNQTTEGEILGKKKGRKPTEA